MNNKEQKAIFAKNLKELIFKSGHTQSEVAKYCKIGEKSFSTYTTARTLPPFDKVNAIANYFGVSAEWLLTDHSPVEIQLTSFQSKFEKLTEANRKTISDMMDVLLAQQNDDKKGGFATA